MIITVCFAVFVVAILIWIYESLILPVLLLERRYEGFKIRDELRELKIKHGDAIPDHLYDHIEATTNNALRLMDTLMLSDLYKFRKKFLKSAEMQEFLSKREGEIEKCQIQEVKQLMARSARNLWLAIVCKQMVFFIQVGILCLPVIIFWDAINKHVIQKTIKWVDRARFSLDKTLDSPPCDAALA